MSVTLVGRDMQQEAYEEASMHTVRGRLSLRLT